MAEETSPKTLITVQIGTCVLSDIQSKASDINLKEDDSSKLSKENLHCVENVCVDNSHVTGMEVLPRQPLINDVDAAEILMGIQSGSNITSFEPKSPKNTSSLDPNVTTNDFPSFQGGMETNNMKKNILRQSLDSESTVECETNEKNFEITLLTHTSEYEILNTSHDSAESVNKRDTSVCPSEINIGKNVLTAQAKAVNTCVCCPIMESNHEADGSKENQIFKLKKKVQTDSHCVVELLEEGNTRSDELGHSSVETGVKSLKVNMNVSDLVKASKKIIGSRFISDASVKNREITHKEGYNESAKGSINNSPKEDFDVENASDLLIAFANKVHRDVAVQEKNVIATENCSIPYLKKVEENCSEMISNEIPECSILKPCDRSNQEEMAAQDLNFSKHDVPDENRYEMKNNRRKNISMVTPSESESLKSHSEARKLALGGVRKLALGGVRKLALGSKLTQQELYEVSLNNKPIQNPVMQNQTNFEPENVLQAAEPSSKSLQTPILSDPAKTKTTIAVSCVHHAEYICNSLATDIKKMDTIHKSQDQLIPFNTSVDEQPISLKCHKENRTISHSNTQVLSNVDDIQLANSVDGVPIKTIYSNDSKMPTSSINDKHTSVIENISVSGQASSNSTSTAQKQCLTIDPSLLRQEMMKLLPELLLQINQMPLSKI